MKTAPASGSPDSSAASLLFPRRPYQPEGLRRICRRKSASGLEPLVDVQSFGCGGNAAHAVKTDVHEIRPARANPSLLLLRNGIAVEE